MSLAKVLGGLLIILGFITIVFGGIGILIYSIYELVVHGGEMSNVEIFWAIIWMIFRDIIAVGIGFLLIVLGGGLGGDY